MEEEESEEEDEDDLTEEQIMQWKKERLAKKEEEWRIKEEEERWTRFNPVKYLAEVLRKVAENKSSVSSKSWSDSPVEINK